MSLPSIIKTDEYGRKTPGPLLYILTFVLLIVIVISYFSMVKSIRSNQELVALPPVATKIINTSILDNFEKPNYSNMLGKSIENVVELHSGQLILVLSDYSIIVASGSNRGVVAVQHMPEAIITQ